VQLQPLVDALAASCCASRAARRRDAGGHAQAGPRQDAPAYLWSYCTTSFNPTRPWSSTSPTAAAASVRDFLGLPGQHGWQGKLVTDDFSGYKACFELGVTEVGCMAHARRKFHELWANHGSQVGEQALKFFGQLYEIEREVAEPRRGATTNPAAQVTTRGRSAPVAARSSGRRCPTARPPPRPSTTASSAGRR
jgi:hypothetical protein